MLPLATEDRKHRANDAKCGELGWLCVPLVAETYGAWGNKAIEAFSQLASRLATLACRPKSAALSEIYGRLNLPLVRANALAILTRCILNELHRLCYASSPCIPISVIIIIEQELARTYCYLHEWSG